MSADAAPRAATHRPPPPAEPCGVSLPFAGHVRSVPPPPLESEVKTRIYAASNRVTLLLPNPMGEYLARELEAYHALGLPLGPSALVARMVDHILRTPVPPAAATPKVHITRRAT